jgi:hypothetical protein
MSQAGKLSLMAASAGTGLVAEIQFAQRADEALNLRQHCRRSVRDLTILANVAVAPILCNSDLSVTQRTLHSFPNVDLKKLATELATEFMVVAL